MRSHWFTTLLIVATAALISVACGGDSEPTSTSGSTRSTEAPGSVTPEPGPDGGSIEVVDGPQATAKLAINLAKIGSKDGGGVPLPEIACTRSIPATCTGELTCPAAESAPAREANACRWLATDAAREVLVPTANDRQVCTMIYGGPETGSITGTVGETKIDAKLSRQNGCEIARWEAAAQLWSTVPDPSTEPSPGAGAAAGSCLATDPDAPVSSDDPGPGAAGAADGAC